MRKFSLLIALMPLVGCIALAPSTAAAQTDAQADAQAEFERAWYSVCYDKQKGDVEKCYQQSKEMVQKYPKSGYIENAKAKIKIYEQNKAWGKFQTTLDAYYKQPPQDAAKLEGLFAAGDAFLEIEPDRQSPFHLFVLGQMALAGHQASLARTYSNLDKVKDYVERALTAFESAKASEKTKKDFDALVPPLKDLVLANGNQFLAFRLIELKVDAEQALAYLTKAIQVKGKDGVGWKDPNNYWLRSTVYSNQYLETKKPYDAMTEDEKRSDAGKEILKKVNELLDTKLIPEYARVLATAPATNPLYEAAKLQFDAFWKFRTEAPEKAADYIKNYVADPTIAPAPIPVKSEDVSGANAPAAPAAGSASVTLQASQPAAASGGKSTTNKKSNLKGRRRGRG